MRKSFQQRISSYEKLEFSFLIAHRKVDSLIYGTSDPFQFFDKASLFMSGRAAGDLAVESEWVVGRMNETVAEKIFGNMTNEESKYQPAPIAQPAVISSNNEPLVSADQFNG